MCVCAAWWSCKYLVVVNVYAVGVIRPWFSCILVRVPRAVRLTVFERFSWTKHKTYVPLRCKYALVADPKHVIKTVIRCFVQCPCKRGGQSSYKFDSSTFRIRLTIKKKLLIFPKITSGVYFCHGQEFCRLFLFNL